MLDYFSGKVFISDDWLDNFVEMDRLKIVGLQDPGECPERVVRKEDNLQTACEDGPVEEIMVKDALEVAALLLLLAEQNGLQQLVVESDSHFQPHPGKGVVRSGMVIGGRRVAVAELVAELQDQVGDNFGGVVVTEGLEEFQELGAGLRAAFVEHVIES